MDHSIETQELLDRAGAGDSDALGELLDSYRERLGLIVRLRIDPRLKGRFDASDVIQEAFVEAAGRFEEYRKDPSMPFFLWLRFLAVQKLMVLGRKHLGTKARDAAREVSLDRAAGTNASSAAMAAQLATSCTTPSQAAMRAELQARVQEALDQLDPIDREVLSLRHFEGLTNSEASHVLGIGEPAASRRYGRAILRIKDVLARIPGGLELG